MYIPDLVKDPIEIGGVVLDVQAEAWVIKDGRGLYVSSLTVDLNTICIFVDGDSFKLDADHFKARHRSLVERLTRRLEAMALEIAYNEMVSA